MMGLGESATPRFDAGIFENREIIKREVEKSLTALRTGNRVSQTSILVWGVRGIGKSRLLIELHHNYPSGESPIPGHKGILTILIDKQGWTDFDNWTTQDANIGTARFLFEIAERLSACCPDELNQTPRDQFNAVVEQCKHGKAVSTQVAKAFSELVFSWTDRFVPLFLFDMIDHLEVINKDLFFWFEENVIAPLLRRDTVFMVMTSGRELRRWKQFDIRRRMTYYHLRGIRPPIRVARQFEYLYPYTFGHPKTTEDLWEQLVAAKSDSENIDQAFVDSHPNIIIRVLRQAQQSFLEDINDDLLRKQLLIIITLRVFHIKSIQKILIACAQPGDPDYQRQSDVFFQTIISKLVGTGLAHWSTELHNYVFYEIVRRIINELEMMEGNPAYARRHTAALSIYKVWISEIPENRSDYIIEALFHTASLAKLQPNPREWLQGAIQQLLQDSIDMTSPNAYEDLQELETGIRIVDEAEDVHKFELRELLGPLYATVLEWLGATAKKVQPLSL